MDHIYYVIRYRRQYDDYEALPRQARFNSLFNRVDYKPQTDPVAEGAQHFPGGIYGRWPARAALNLRRRLCANVPVYLEEQHPVTEQPMYLNIG